MDTYTVESAEEYFLPNGEPGWQLKLRRGSDNKGGSYLFPEAAFEWRAAEYDLDPTDKDTLLDIILHEPFAGYSRENVSKDPAFTEGGLSVARTSNKGLRRVGDPEPVSLMNADTIEQARTAMLLRIQNAKQNRVRVIDSGAPDEGRVESPLTKIKSRMNLDLQAIEDKKRFVTLRRKGRSETLSKAEAEEFQELNRLIDARKGREGK